MLCSNISILIEICILFSFSTGQNDQDSELFQDADALFLLLTRSVAIKPCFGPNVCPKESIITCTVSNPSCQHSRQLAKISAKTKCLRVNKMAFILLQITFCC